jgi:chemotaxis protein CheY-P-specific phosphatase CheC
MAQNNPFEIPEQMRQMAEQSVEQARNTYGQFMDAMLQAQSMWFSSMPGNPAVDSFKEVQELGMQFARENADTALNLATEISKAKDLTEVLSIQSRYAQTQMQRFASQGQQLGQTISQAAQRAATQK